MKILYFITTLPENHNSTTGMGGNCWLDFFTEISKKHKVSIVTPLLDKNQKRYTHKGNLKVIRVTPLKPSFSLENTIDIPNAIKTISFLFNMWKTAFKLNKNEKFDIIHGLWIFPNGLIASFMGKNTKKIISSPGSDLHTWSYKPLIKFLIKYTIKKTDYCTCVTKKLCKRAKELGAKRLSYIPVPSNSEIFKLHKTIKEPNSILFSGRLTRKKGIFILIKAIKILKNKIPKIKLYICGTGPDKEKIIYLIKKYNLKNNIKILTNIKRKELIEINRKCKCLVLPSHNEGLPACVLESMFIGRPIIATDVGDLKRFIKKDMGEIIPKNNSKELIKAIIKVLNKKYDSKTIRKGAMEADTKNVVKSYIKLYNKLLK